MIKSYFANLWQRFKAKSIFSKIFILLFILLEIAIIFLCFWKTNYNITSPGSVEEANDTIIIDTKNTKGHILTVSVSEFDKASALQYLLARKNDKFAIEVNDESEITNKDYDILSVILKRASINSAIILAYSKAKEIDESIYLAYEFKGLQIYYLKKSVSDLKLGDIITHIDGVKITDRESFLDQIDILLGEDRTGGTKKVGDSIEFTLIRDNVILNRSAVINENDGKLSIGINLIESYELDAKNSVPTFQINYNERFDASGSSGGAMMTLAVYNSLIPEDITHGLFIAGTGTIDANGNIGAIGAIEQKTIEVFTKGLDIFFVDGEKSSDGTSDYSIAIETAKKYGYDETKIIEVNTLDDIINYLKGLGD